MAVALSRWVRQPEAPRRELFALAMEPAKGLLTAAHPVLALPAEVREWLPAAHLLEQSTTLLRQPPAPTVSGLCRPSRPLEERIFAVCTPSATQRRNSGNHAVKFGKNSRIFLVFCCDSNRNVKRIAGWGRCPVKRPTEPQLCITCQKLPSGHAQLFHKWQTKSPPRERGGLRWSAEQSCSGLST